MCNYAFLYVMFNYNILLNILDHQACIDNTVHVGRPYCIISVSGGSAINFYYNNDFYRFSYNYVIHKNFNCILC